MFQYYSLLYNKLRKLILPIFVFLYNKIGYERRIYDGFFEYYLKLDEKEEEELVKQINQFDNAEDFFELPNSWRDKGQKKDEKKD